MRHPDDGELLAYSKNEMQSPQKRNESTQHLAQCLSCQERYSQLLHAERLLRSYMRKQVYPSIVDDVLRQARQLEPTPFERIVGKASFRIVSIPAAAILGVICVFTITVLAAKQGSNWSPFPSKINNHPTAGPTSIIVPPLPAVPFISMCGQQSEGDKGYILICGNNYTPGAQVELLVTVPQEGVIIHTPVRVNSKGSLQDSIYISSCKHVPSAIVAINVHKQTEQSQILEHVTFGSCSSVSEVVGTSEQFEAWSIGPANTRKTGL